MLLCHFPGSDLLLAKLGPRARRIDCPAGIETKASATGGSFNIWRGSFISTYTVYTHTDK